MTDLWESLLHSSHSQVIFVLLCLILAILLFDRILKMVLKKILKRLGNHTESLTHAFLKDDRLVFWILAIPYLAALNVWAQSIPDLPESILAVVNRVVMALYILFGFLIFSSCLRIINDIYNRSAISRMRPIKGYLQSVQIIVFIASFILILSALMDKSPLIFISGLGAMTAILMLVFKDTILSFVAGVQLTTNGLLRVGDWIEMPQFSADGDVIEIALNTVTIQNWDKTFTIIPAHKFLEHSFKNWRGMHESGGRRIKRSILIDLNSVKFLKPEDLKKLQGIKVLKSYLDQKLSELHEYNTKLAATMDDFSPSDINYRRLTNVGTFRAYIIEYLKAHPMIHKNMTFLVRQLAPSSEGLPLEVYVFTTDTRWAIYESVQADIFDHLYSVIHDFDLRPFQAPSGQDLKVFTKD